MPENAPAGIHSAAPRRSISVSSVVNSTKPLNRIRYPQSGQMHPRRHLAMLECFALRGESPCLPDSIKT